MRTGVDEERDSVAAFELAAGCVVVVVAAFTAAALFGPAEQIARAVLGAIAVGGLAVVLRDWRSWAGLTVLAALVYVGFLAHQAGQLTGDPTPWRCTLIIGLAALLGRAGRWIRTVRTAPAPVVRNVRPPRRSFASTRPTSVRF